MDQFDRDSTISDFKNAVTKLLVNLVKGFCVEILGVWEFGYFVCSLFVHFVVCFTSLFV